VTDPLCQAVERAWKAGIVVVCAAGNHGRSIAADPTALPAYATIDSPGNDPYVITVGATKGSSTPDRSDDAMASYSGHGPSRLDFVLKPDLVAPGNRVIAGRCGITSYLEPAYDPTNLIAVASYWPTAPLAEQPRYFVLSGTSMSAAVVSGRAALMIGQ